MTAAIHVGTCGFAHPAWVGTFYPGDARPSELLPLLQNDYARAAIVPSAKRPIVNSASLQHRQIGLAVRDGDRV